MSRIDWSGPLTRPWPTAPWTWLHPLDRKRDLKRHAEAAMLNHIIPVSDFASIIVESSGSGPIRMSGERDVAKQEREEREVFGIEPPEVPHHD